MNKNEPETIADMAKSVRNERIQKEWEEAIQETPTDKMDRIIQVHEQWETVNLLIKLMNRELKIPDTAQPSDVRQAMDNLQKNYHEAMKEWRKIREK